MSDKPSELKPCPRCERIAIGFEDAVKVIPFVPVVHITTDYPGGGEAPLKPSEILYNGVRFVQPPARAALEFVAEMALLHAAVLFAQGARVIDAKLSAITLVNKYLAEQAGKDAE